MRLVYLVDSVHLCIGALLYFLRFRCIEVILHLRIDILRIIVFCVFGVLACWCISVFDVFGVIVYWCIGVLTDVVFVYLCIDVLPY